MRKTYGSLSTPVPPSHKSIGVMFVVHQSWIQPSVVVPFSTINWSNNYISLWLSSSNTMTWLWTNTTNNKESFQIHTTCMYLTALQHASFKQCVFPLEKAVIQVSQCEGDKLEPLWPLALELGPASGEVGETGTSKAGLGICKAARLLFFARLLVWRGGEVLPWELAVCRGPQLVESSGDGSEFTAGLLSGQVWTVCFPWGHDVERSGERVADSSRPLVPCVHWKGTRKRRRGEKKKRGTDETRQWG